MESRHPVQGPDAGERAGMGRLYGSMDSRPRADAIWKKSLHKFTELATAAGCMDPVGMNSSNLISMALPLFGTPAGLSMLAALLLAALLVPVSGPMRMKSAAACVASGIAAGVLLFGVTAVLASKVLPLVSMSVLAAACGSAGGSILRLIELAA